MKKFINALLITFAFSLMFSSCARPDKALPSKDGKWNFTGVDNDGTTTYTYGGTMSFTKEGNGVIAITSGLVSGFSSNYTWSYDKSGEKITIVTPSSGIITGSTTVYDVQEAKSKSEKWYTEETVGGVKSTTTITLTR
jgi:hypothetical protein